MKQIFSSIAILLLLVLFSITDFDLGNFPDASDKITDWDASQHDCLDHKLSDQVMGGSDGACVAASMEILAVMNKYQVDCLYITNNGWIPTPHNPVTRHWAEWSLSNDAPY